MCDLCYILGMSGPPATVTRETLQRREDTSVTNRAAETESWGDRWIFRRNKSQIHREPGLTDGQMATQRGSKCKYSLGFMDVNFMDEF